MIKKEVDNTTLMAGGGQAAPASAAVSATPTPPSEKIEGPDAVIYLQGELDAPLVDEALSEASHGQDKAKEISSTELVALRADISRLTAMLQETSAAGISLAQNEIVFATRRAQDRVRADPLKAIFVAACVGYMLGRIS